jgi:hypothetical protein
MLCHFGFKKSNCDFPQGANARSKELFLESSQHPATSERFGKLMTRCREPQRLYRPLHLAISTPLHPQVTVTIVSDASVIAQEQ